MNKNGTIPFYQVDYWLDSHSNIEAVTLFRCALELQDISSMALSRLVHIMVRSASDGDEGGEG